MFLNLRATVTDLYLQSHSANFPNKQTNKQSMINAHGEGPDEGPGERHVLQARVGQEVGL